MEQKEQVCSVAKKCGGCRYQGVPYEEQLRKKQRYTEGLLKKFGKVEPIIGMENPYYYRNKVHAAFGRDRKGNIISGIYEERSHHIVSVDDCMIEDKKSQEIIRTIRGMLKSFKIKTYDEDTGYGLLRHVLVRRGFSTGEIMVVLVTVSPIFPSKNNFVKALRKEHRRSLQLFLNVRQADQHGAWRKEYCTLWSRIYKRPSYGTDIPYFPVFILSGESCADRSSLW